MSYAAPSAYAYRNSLPRRMPISSKLTDQSLYQSRDVSSRFGARLRELRHEHSLTQLRMAVDFGIDRSFISDVERGRKTISLPMLEVVALGLHLTLADLLEGI
jgi:DNA-binding XRE family transcriptional regulator